MAKVILVNVAPRKTYSFGHFLLDLFLTAITCGFWLVWLLLKALFKAAN